LGKGKSPKAHLGPQKNKTRFSPPRQSPRENFSRLVIHSPELRANNRSIQSNASTGAVLLGEFRPRKSGPNSDRDRDSGQEMATNGGSRKKSRMPCRPTAEFALLPTSGRGQEMNPFSTEPSLQSPCRAGIRGGHRRDTGIAGLARAKKKRGRVSGGNSRRGKRRPDDSLNRRFRAEFRWNPLPTEREASRPAPAERPEAERVLWRIRRRNCATRSIALLRPSLAFMACLIAAAS